MSTTTENTTEALNKAHVALQNLSNDLDQLLTASWVTPLTRAYLEDMQTEASITRDYLSIATESHKAMLQESVPLYNG